MLIFLANLGQLDISGHFDSDVFVLSQFPWIQIKDSKQTSRACGGAWHPFKKHLDEDMDGGVHASLTV